MKAKIAANRAKTAAQAYAKSFGQKYGTKQKRSAALKVISIWQMANMIVSLAMQGFDRSSGYNYVSFPREWYDQFTPDFDQVVFNGIIDDGYDGYVDYINSDGNSALYHDYHFLARSSEMFLDTMCRGDENCMYGDSNIDPAFERMSPFLAERRLSASFTGAESASGMGNDSDDLSSDILLTFGGGGSSVDYSYVTDEKTSDHHYALDVSLHGESKNTHEVEMHGVIGTIATIAMQLAGVDEEAQNTFVKEIGYDRAFAWTKHGHLSTLYTLGDPDFRDKFVVQVKSDWRFGTPVFITKGGRSSCPGEDGTVFRESGWKLEVSATNNRNLDPGERALLTVIVTNDSPYRESTPLGLRLIDGVAQAVYDIIDVANAALYAANADVSSIQTAIIAACDESSASDSTVVRSISAAVSSTTGASTSPADVVTAAVNAARLAPALGSEISDMKITVNDIKMSPFGEMIPLLPSGSAAAPLTSQMTSPQATFTLAVQPLGETPSAIDGLGLQLLSACEWDLSSWKLNRNPIAHTISLGDISWSRRCPEVRFDETTVARHAFSKVSTTEPGPLDLTVYNPNRALLWPDADLSDPSLMSDTLKKTVVQYRPITGGEWITAKDEASTEDSYKFNYISRNNADNSIACTSSRTEGCLFQWNVNNAYDKLLSGFKDGVYEVRVKNFCFGGNALADTSVHEYVSDQILNLVVDTVPPETKSFHHDDLARSVWIEYFESVDCSNSALKLTRTYLDGECKTVDVDVSTEDIEFEFKVVCYDTAWLLKFPSYLNGTVTGTLSGIQDLSGLVADDYTFVFSTGNMTVDGCGTASNAATAAAAAALGAIEVKRAPSALGEEHSRGFATAAPFVSATTSATIFLVGALVLSAFFAIRARSSTSPALSRARRVGERSALRTEDARRESLGYGAVV